ncbi:MAG: NADH-quinone oxidoreductase subunit NuoG [Deltaproteobacteria bacterium]|nr:NADH-quinone oxidoreductase subunit NuoG [Deltaproteobacteria bacterium]
MATVKVNGKEITVEDGTLILDAARQAGFEIPTFCYQARLSRLGSCRMCLVEVEGQKKLQPSCVTPVIHGMSVYTESPAVISARQSMLEFLLANHPLDCPVCDKGGECELQDMVFKFGPREGRFAEWKLRHHEKDYILSPVIVKNSNRCVQCQRCVRICSEIVGANALGSIGRGAHQEETSFLKKPLNCDQCGNCIEVCPVGSFMSLSYRYKSRPWDLKETDTVCPYCATGCQFTIGIRNGEIVRVRSKVDTGINRETLCARGRFGFDFIQSEKRLKRPMIKKDGKLVESSWDEALSVVKERFGKGKRTAGIASSRLTNEELFVFQRLLREVFETNNIDLDSRFANKWVTSQMVDVCGLAGGGISVFDALKSDLIFVIGSSISSENPITDYLIRESISDRRKTLITAYPRRMKLDSSALIALRYKPGDEGEVIKGIIDFIENNPPIPPLPSTFTEVLGLEDIDAAAVRFKAAEGITIFVGVDILRFDSGRDVLASLAKVKRLLKDLGKDVMVRPLFDRPNQYGARTVGIHPLFLPGIKRAKEDGMDSGEILEAILKGEIDNLYVLAEDVVSMCPDAGFAREAISNVRFLVVQDVFLTETARMADVVLPGATYAEKDGTFTNQEGRVQRVRKVILPPGDSRDDLTILCSIGGFKYKSARDVFEDIKREVAGYRDISFDMLDGNGALVKGHKTENQGSRGQARPASRSEAGGVKGSSEIRINPSNPRTLEPSNPYLDEYPFLLMTGNHLFHSGRLSQYADVLMQLLGEPFVEIDEEDANAIGLVDKDKVVVKSKGYSTQLSLRVVRGSERGVAFIPENFDKVPVNHFFKRGQGIPRVKIVKQL